MVNKEEVEEKTIPSGIGNKVSEFVLRLAAYGGLTHKEGIITMWNDYHVFTPISTFYILQKELIKKYKEDGENLIYWLGKINGKTGTTALIKRFGIKSSNFGDLVNGASIDGWGKLKILEIENDKKNPTSAKIECRNSTLAKYYLAQKDIQKKGVDYFMKGELAGGVEPLLNKQVKTEEVECISKGEPRCLYSIFIEKDKLKCDFLKHIPFEEEKIIKKVSAITLKRKSGFSILNKGKIKFGDGEFKIEEVQGILYLSYVQAILEHVLLKNNKKEYFEIMDKISEESSRIIYEKVKGTRDLNEVFKKIEILGFGELKLRKISKNIFFASNSSNPVSKDYLKIFGKCSFSRDYLLSKIIEKTLKKILKKECVVSEEKCIARGDRKCLFKIKITK